MITSQMSRAEYPCRVTVLLNTMEGQGAGLLTDSVVMADNLATITLSAIYRAIGSLSMSEVDKALKYTLGL
jgi:mRNA interferase MazF